MERLENVATPADATTVVVPESVPPPGLVPIATVMQAVGPVRMLPNATCTATCTAGQIAAPAITVVGCTVKPTWDAAAGVMLNGSDVAPVSPAEAPVSV